jgi:lipid-binding SYLF domain-containing protein
MKNGLLSAAVIAFSGSLAIAGAQAQTTAPASHAQPSTTAPASGSSQPQATAQKAPDATQLVRDTEKTVQEMKKDQKFANYMKQAKGIFILPSLVKGSLIVGGQGGQGVLLAHKNGKWSDPAFFSLGSISIGAQAGGAAGPVAFLLMSDKALNEFTESNNFSLNANAGLTIVTYSARGQADVGKGDIIVWSNMSGLQGSLNVSATDIVRNSNEDKDFYGHQVGTKQIIDGQAQNPAASQLRSELPS